MDATLGISFERKLIKLIIGTRKKKGQEIYRESEFGIGLIPILSSEYFSDENHAFIVNLIMDFHKRFKSIPYYDTIIEIVGQKFSSQQRTISSVLSDIENSVIENITYVQDEARDFITRKKLKRAFENGLVELEMNSSMDSQKLLDRLRKEIFIPAKIGKSITFDADYDFDHEPRFPIASGLGTGFDEVLGGGLARGEMALIIAQTGVGKTTAATCIATKAFSEGKNVVLIFFEGTYKQLEAKFLAKWAEMSINEAVSPSNKSYVQSQYRKKIMTAKEKGGNLIIQKFKAGRSTIDDIENYLHYVRYVLNLNIDSLIFDYVDCVAVDTSNKNQKTYEGEAQIIRRIEDMISPEEYNAAGWIFTQTNRSGEIQGSYVKEQAGHVNVKITKTPEQTETKTANIKITKNRFGSIADFENETFNNGMVIVNIKGENIINGHQKNNPKQ